MGPSTDFLRREGKKGKDGAGGSCSPRRPVTGRCIDCHGHTAGPAWMGPQGVDFVRDDDSAEVRVEMRTPAQLRASWTCLREPLLCSSDGFSYLNTRNWGGRPPTLGSHCPRGLTDPAVPRIRRAHEMGYWLGNNHEEPPTDARRLPRHVPADQGQGLCRPNPWATQTQQSQCSREAAESLSGSFWKLPRPHRRNPPSSTARYSPSALKRTPWRGMYLVPAADQQLISGPFAASCGSWCITATVGSSRLATRRRRRRRKRRPGSATPPSATPPCDACRPSSRHPSGLEWPLRSYRSGSRVGTRRRTWRQDCRHGRPRHPR